MELLQFEYFYKIANSRTITEAAEDLCVSQPSLSKMIRRLENELNTVLFYKDGRHLKLTENGKVFLKYATDILETIDLLKRDICNNKERTDMQLEVNFLAGSSLLSDILKKFRKCYPNIKVKIRQHNVNLDKRNSADITIFYEYNDRMIDVEDIILEEDIMLAVPENCSMAERDRISLKELRNMDFEMVGMPKGTKFRNMMDFYCELADVNPEVSIESDDPATLRKLIANGFGMAFYPEKTWLVEQNSKIKLLKLENPKCKRYLYLRTKDKNYTNTATLLFKNFIFEYFSNL